MKYRIYCHSCHWSTTAQTKREAQQIERRHRREKPCDWFLEFSTNIEIELMVPAKS